MREGAYQSRLIRKLENLFPGCVVIKNDPSYIQGIPDLIVLFRNTWAMLEVKRSEDENPQPNQAYYVERFGEMSFSSFIHPENEERVLNDLQLAFSAFR